MARNYNRPYSACLKQVNGSSPPVSFLDELVDWALTAPDEIFVENTKNEIYSSVVGELGPYESPVHRKAVMLEVLRVLAGHESTWRWIQGVDAGKSTPNTATNEEAGAFQCSADSMNLDASLKALLQKVAGKTDTSTFITTTKQNHPFAIEYCARLLRVTTNHHGPIKNRHIHRKLQRAAASEFMTYLS